jgi:hypothetical protein
MAIEIKCGSLMEWETVMVELVGTSWELFVKAEGVIISIGLNFESISFGYFEAVVSTWIPTFLDMNS